MALIRHWNFGVLVLARSLHTLPLRLCTQLCEFPSSGSEHVPFHRRLAPAIFNALAVQAFPDSPKLVEAGSEAFRFLSSSSPLPLSGPGSSWGGLQGFSRVQEALSGMTNPQN